jgi:primosomal protein N'
MDSMYAEVAINVPVSGTFHYHIPPEMDIQPGHLVQVAFGVALQFGIVLWLYDDSPVEQPKPILARLDPQPVVTQQQIEFAYWLSQTYLAPLGLCLWLMLPPGMTGQRDLVVKLLDKNAASPDALEQKIISLLKRRGSLRGSRLNLALPGESWRSAVDTLAKAGVVAKEHVLTPPRLRPKTVQTVALAIHPNDIPNVARHLGKESSRANILEVLAAMPDEQPAIAQVLDAADANRNALNQLAKDNLITIDKASATVSLNIPRDSVDEQLIELRKGEKYLHILRVLARESEPVDVTWLYAQTDARLDDLRRLDDDGLVILGEKQTWRDSLSERDFVPSVAPTLTPEQQDVWAVIREAIQAWAWETPPPAPPRTRRGEEHEEPNADERLWRIPPVLWDKLKPLARQMRHEPTRAEDILWQQVRRNALGHPIRRQHPFGRFIVDFYCAVAHLVIEVDGDIHDYTQEEDAVRQEILENLGLKVIRFKNDEIIHSLDTVLGRIKEEIATAQQPTSSSPLSVYGEGLGEGFSKNQTQTFLLHGVTGSGKTEIYLRAIELTLAQGRQAVFLVPEIALTAQTVRRVAARFPKQVAVVHSGLSEGERHDTWRRARDGLIQVVVGARSALFTPLPDIGLIILDEEHDDSYKQSQSVTGPPYYHARDVAEEMMQRNNGVVILGSATPDLETVYRAQRGDIQRLHLPSRIMGHRTRILEQSEREGVIARYYPTSADDALTIDLPPVDVVDMREELKSGNTSIFSRQLQDALAETLERKEQAILFLNRRGTATYVFCRDCGYVAACPRCDMPLTYHQQGEALRCHHCGYQQPQPIICPNCQSKRIRYFGAGTQQVEQALIEQFPQVRVLRWDTDTATTPGMHEVYLQRFIDRKADVIVGTQMITKGLDLPLVTLVGVVSADMGLAMPDFRAGERTFQLLMQVAGRAGRGLLGGQVVLQTYQPDHYIIQAAARHDYEGFYQQEIAYRRELGYPPFRKLARMVFRYNSDLQAQSEAERAANLLRTRLEKLRMSGTEIIGPAPCFFHRVNNVYRWHLLLRGPDPVVALRGMDIARGWHVDVEPVDVL